MNIAILGANSTIAMDFLCRENGFEGKSLSLFSRNSPQVKERMSAVATRAHRIDCLEYADFGARHYDVIINFVGLGAPKNAAGVMGTIFEINLEYDEKAIAYLKANPACKYIYISSGAVYGTQTQPQYSLDSARLLKVNALTTENTYSLAKLSSEMRHRLLKEMKIIDLRVYNYISRNQNLTSGFLFTDIASALVEKRALSVSADDAVRDFLHPDDFEALLWCLIDNCDDNVPVDCYSQGPVGKFTLLDRIKDAFGLDYTVTQNVAASPTGLKPAYCSQYKIAESYGYRPYYSSLSGIEAELQAILTPIPQMEPHINDMMG